MHKFLKQSQIKEMGGNIPLMLNLTAKTRTLEIQTEKGGFKREFLFLFSDENSFLFPILICFNTWNI